MNSAMKSDEQKTVAVLGAMDEEVSLITDSLSDVKEFHEAGLFVKTGFLKTIKGHSIRVVATVAGMGTVAAGAATQYLITRFHPHTLLFSGIAGNVSKDLHINDVVIGEHLAYLDTDIALISQAPPHLKQYASDPHLVELGAKVLTEQGIKHKKGFIATSNRFIDTPEQKVFILEQYPQTDAVEMEGAAVAHIAAKNDVPVLILRALSDNTETDYEEFKDFDISEYANTAASIVVNILKNL